MDKKELRKLLRKKRDSFDYTKRKDLDEKIRNIIFSENIYRDSKYIFTYISFSSEVDTIEIIKGILEDGKTLLVPRINMEEKTMKTIVLEDLNQLEELEWGILSTRSNKEYLGEIDLVLTPLLGINNRGYRLGYGGGYYDRFFKERTCKNKVGLSYSFQMTDAIPVDEWDIKLDYILNEFGLMKSEG